MVGSLPVGARRRVTSTVLGAVIPQSVQQGMDLGGGVNGEPIHGGGSHELMKPQGLTGGVDERVRSQRIPGEPVTRQVEGSREALEEIIGTGVHTFAYPFGRYGPAAIAAARDSGLLAAVTTGSGSWQPYEITRAMIGAADPLPVVLLKLTDRYEPLLASPPMRALRRASKRLRSVIRSARGSGDPPA